MSAQPSPGRNLSRTPACGLLAAILSLIGCFPAAVPGLSPGDEFSDCDAWNDEPWFLRAASRLTESTDFRYLSVGFRVARTLN